MYNPKVILFFEFLKENQEVLENLDIQELNLEVVENKIVPFARENGFDITAKDIFGFLEEIQEQSDGLIDDSMLENVAGGRGVFSKFVATGLLALTGITGFIGNIGAVQAAGSGHAHVSQGKKVKSAKVNKTAVIRKIIRKNKKAKLVKANEIVKNVKSVGNNTLSQEEKAYYQSKIGKNYHFVSDKGMSGQFATAYKIEDKKGNQFVLKISNNPENTKTWMAGQKATAEKIKKYYGDYKGGLKLTNYVSFGEDFVIEENLGNQIGKEEFWSSLSEEEVSKFINDMAEFLKYTQSKERGAVKPISLDRTGHTLDDSYNYLKDAGALNEDESRMILDLINKFRTRDRGDEITCLNHTDIRFQNIVYNSKTKQFALIDFDSLAQDRTIYEGFTSLTIGSQGIPFDIISKIVDKYNEISDIKISKDKLKLIYKLGTMWEYTAVAKYLNKYSGKDVKEITWDQFLKPNLEKIEKGFES